MKLKIMNRNKQRLLLIIIGVFITPLLYSQQTKPNNDPWTLKECIEYAYQNNINVKRSSLNLTQNQATLQQSKAELLPSLNASASNTYNFGKNQNPTNGNIEDFNARTNTFGISAGVVLFNGMANYNTIKQNNLMLESALADLEKTKNDIGLAVAQAYLLVLVNEELLNSAIVQLDNSNEQLSRTKKLVIAGSLAKLDELQALSQQATNETQVVGSTNNLNLSKLQLMQLLQLPYNPGFRIVNPDIELTGLEPLPSGTTAIYEMALQTQPQVKSTEFSIEASKASLAAAKGGRLPRISAFAGMDTRYSGFAPAGFEPDAFSDQLDSNLGQNVGLSLSIPIFNNYRVKQSVQNSIINLERAELNDIDIKNGLRQEIEQAYFNAIAAYNSYNSAVKQVDALRLTYDNMTKQHEIGGINSTDYLLAQNNLTSAESDMIRAKYDYIFKTKILDFYQGKTLDF